MHTRFADTVVPAYGRGCTAPIKAVGIATAMEFLGLVSPHAPRASPLYLLCACFRPAGWLTALLI